MGASETIGHEVTTGIAGVLGLEPRLNEPESLVLPITPYPKVCWPLWGQRNIKPQAGAVAQVRPQWAEPFQLQVDGQLP